MASTNEVVIRILLEQPVLEKDRRPKKEFKEVGERTPSQQLRLALRRRHLGAGGSDETFEEYYKREMARLIAAVEPKK